MSSQDHREMAKSQGVITIAIVTVSDTRTPENDFSGQTIRQLSEAAGHRISGYRIVKDEPDQVADALEQFVNSEARLIIFNGGTGISQRDRTYDVIKENGKGAACFGEIFRMLSYEQVRGRHAQPGNCRRLSNSRGRTRVPPMQCAWRWKLILPEIQHLAWELIR